MSQILTELYQQVILDHNQNPRNFRKLKGATNQAEGYNPLCGDRITVEVRLAGDTIEDVGFQGSGCAISKASASVMSTMVKGKTILGADELFKQFRSVITRGLGSEIEDFELGKLVVFAGVRKFPARIKCAALAWHTLQAALHEKNELVSTE